MSSSYILEVDYYLTGTHVMAMDDDRGTFYEHTYDLMADKAFESELEGFRFKLGYDKCAEVIRRDFRVEQSVQERQRTPGLFCRLVVSLGLGGR